MYSIFFLLRNCYFVPSYRFFCVCLNSTYCNLAERLSLSTRMVWNISKGQPLVKECELIISTQKGGVELKVSTSCKFKWFSIYTWQLCVEWVDIAQSLLQCIFFEFVLIYKDGRYRYEIWSFFNNVCIVGYVSPDSWSSCMTLAGSKLTVLF